MEKPEAVKAAEEFLADHPRIQERFDRTAKLIEGFETPFGMEPSITEADHQPDVQVKQTWYYPTPALATTYLSIFVHVRSCFTSSI